MIKKFLRQNLIIILMGFAVIASGGALMIVSQNVYNAQSRIHQMENERQAIEWEIRSLNAELTYLSRPDRMEQLTAAIAHSGLPKTNGNAVVISPVAFSSYEPQSFNLIPQSKPWRVSTSTHTPSPSPQKAQKPLQNFSSLLDKLERKE